MFVADQVEILKHFFTGVIIVKFNDQSEHEFANILNDSVHWDCCVFVFSE